MTIPTRIIEHDEFEKLIRLENGNDINRFQLTPYFYTEGEVGEGMSGMRGQSVFLTFLNVVDPVLYKDPEHGFAIIIANKHQNWGYKDIEDLCPRRGADMYVVCPDGWDITDFDHDLDDAWFFFRGKGHKLPKVSIEEGQVLPVDKRGSAH